MRVRHSGDAFPSSKQPNHTRCGCVGGGRAQALSPTHRACGCTREEWSTLSLESPDLASIPWVLCPVPDALLLSPARIHRVTTHASAIVSVAAASLDDARHRRVGDACRAAQKKLLNIPALESCFVTKDPVPTAAPRPTANGTATLGPDVIL